jgi:predicted dienelactone hydrolase
MRLLLVVLLVACSGSKQETPSTTPDAGGPRVATAGSATWEKPGTFTVGHAFSSVANGDRKLSVQTWYPSRAPSSGTPIEELVVDAADRATMVGLLAKASCVRKRVGSTKDLAPADGKFPVIAYSHCHSCTRFSSAAIAERLASHGFIVVAPDHVGNTVFDAQRGMSAPLNGEFLATRAADIKAVLDAALMSPSVDANAVGMFGHSYGGATTGLVLARDARVRAGLAIGAPMENDLLPPAKMAEIKVPAMFLLAREDNSISEIGNNIIRSNFKSGNPPIWLAEVEDAGHWSFSDIASLTPSLMAGCGSATRQTEPGESFQYLEIESARALAASYVTAFFASTLLANADAKAFLTAKHPSGVVMSSSR